MDKTKTARQAQLRRHARVRKHVKGTAEKPRLTVFRSLKNIYAQVVNDIEGETICSASSLSKEMGLEKGSAPKMALSKEVGRLVAEKALKKNITHVVFDKGGYKYHGRVKALAEAAREAGLKF